MELLEKKELLKSPILKSPQAATPCISIYVDQVDENGRGTSGQTQNGDTTANAVVSAHDDDDDKNAKMIKCKSMQNMKLMGSLIDSDRYKQNLSLFNNNSQFPLAHQVIPIKPEASRFRHNATNYRKCLSRVNLNLYQNSPLVHSPSHDQNESPQPTNVANAKLLKINPVRGVKIKSFPINAVSIMNLENCVDNLGLEKPATHSSRRNLLINKSYSNLSNNFSLLASSARKPAATPAQLTSHNLNQPSCMLLNSSSSHLNLYKSSNSLNALDLDLMESVSVGSFDRLSLYSCGAANSESDLNQCFYVEMIEDGSDGPDATNGLNLGGAGGARNQAAVAKSRQVTSNGFALIDSAMSNLKENRRVIDWLENI